MIRFIEGEYLYYQKGAIVVKTAGGIGFRIFVPDTSPVLNMREGDRVGISTYMQVKDDGISLYGFTDTDGLDLFEQLITVKGVGPKAGLAIMSLGEPGKIKSHIKSKDASYIAKAQGIGKKTAERVILELCDKVTALPLEEAEGAESVDGDAAAGAMNDERTEAVMALTTLGYSRSEAEDAVAHVEGENLTAEEYVKGSLKYLL